MGRLIAGAATGVIVWFVVTLILIVALRAVDPALSAALNVHATVATLVGRLAISFVASLIGGLVAAWIAKGNQRAALFTGIVLLVIFVPYHTTIWQQFPIWYHLTFFVSLLVLSVVGGRFAPAR